MSRYPNTMADRVTRWCSGANVGDIAQAIVDLELDLDEVLDEMNEQRIPMRLTGELAELVERPERVRKARAEKS